MKQSRPLFDLNPLERRMFLSMTPLAAVADAHVVGGSFGNTNYGQYSEMLVKYNATYAEQVRETFLKFDTSSVVGTLSNALLRLNGKLLDNRAMNLPVVAHGVSTTTWAENTITFNTKPGAGANLASTTIVNDTAQWYEWDLTSYVNQERAAGRAVVSVVLKTSTATQPYALFYSDEYGTAANRPRLELTTVAAPAAPSGLSATNVAVNQVRLQWADNSANEDGFRVERATNDTFTQGLTTLTAAAGALEITDTIPSPGATYFYRVKAYNTGGDSGPSNTAVAAPRDAFAPIEGESFDGKPNIPDGVLPYPSSQPNSVAYINYNSPDSASSWAKFSRVNFGSAEAKQVTINIGATADEAGNWIDVWVDGRNGTAGATRVGTVQVQATGSWQTFLPHTLALDVPVTGVRDVYLQARQGTGANWFIGAIDSFQFGTADLTVSASPATSTQLVNLSWPAVSGAAAYRVQRSSDNGATWGVLTTTDLPAGTTTTSDRNYAAGPGWRVWPSTSYRYRVTAYDAAGAPTFLKIAAATTADFRVFDAMDVTSKPDFRPHGLERMRTVYQGELFPNGQIVDDATLQNTINTIAAQAASEQKALAIDIESAAFWDNQPGGRLEALRDLVKMAQWAKAGRDSLEIGIYIEPSFLPSDDTQGDRWRGYDASHTGYDPTHDVVKNYDFLGPDLYARTADPDAWYAGTLNRLTQVKRLTSLANADDGKSRGVYPFLWRRLQTNTTGPTGEPPLALDFHLLQLAVRRADVDGVILWDVGDWNASIAEYSDWWTTAQQFLNQSAQPAPAAPSNLMAAADGMALSWVDNSNAEMGFLVERSADPNVWDAAHDLQTFMVVRNTQAWSDHTAIGGQTYHYRVRAFNGINESAASNTAGQTLSRNARSRNHGEGFDSTPSQWIGRFPAPPARANSVAYVYHNEWIKFAGVDFGTASPTQVTLNIAAGPQETGSRVEVWIDGPPGSTGSTKLGEVVVQSTGDPGWQAFVPHSAELAAPVNNLNTPHDVYLRTIWGSSTSGYSGAIDWFRFDTAPGTPAAFSASGEWSSGVAGIRLNWTRRSTDETGFRIERKATGGTWTSHATVGPGSTTYLDTTNVAAATFYSYRVVALNAYGESAPSHESTAMVRNAFAAIEGESFDLDNGVTGGVELFPPGSTTPNAVGYIYGRSPDSNSDWAKFSGVDFGSTSPTQLIVNLGASSSEAGNWLDVWVDGPNGTTGALKIGEVLIESTGAWQFFANRTINLTASVTGVHDVYIQTRLGTGTSGYTGAIDWFRFL